MALPRALHFIDVVGDLADGDVVVRVKSISKHEYTLKFEFEVVVPIDCCHISPDQSQVRHCVLVVGGRGVEQF